MEQGKHKMKVWDIFFRSERTECVLLKGGVAYLLTEPAQPFRIQKTSLMQRRSSVASALRTADGAADAVRLCFFYSFTYCISFPFLL